MRHRMRRMHVLIAMVALSSLVLVYFYPFLHLQMPPNRRSLLEDSPVDPIIQDPDITLLPKPDDDIKFPPKQETVPQMPTPVSITRPVQKAVQKAAQKVVPQMPTPVSITRPVQKAVQKAAQKVVPQMPTPVSITRPVQKAVQKAAQKVVRPLSVSDSFRKAIPQDTAFWNRKLGWLMKQLDKGEYSAEKNKLNWLSCREMNQDLLQTNMHDFGAYPDLHQDFLRGMDCRDPPIVINQPNKCSADGGDGHTFLLFAIKSTANNFEERQVVRETWGKEGTYGGGLMVRTVFLVGGSSMDDPDLSKLLLFEAKHFGDVLQWDFYDTFFNLTLKEHVFYRWAMDHCPNVSFVFKGDDDVFVNTPVVLSYLQSLTPDEASNSYTGHIIYSASPLRNPQSKYFVPLTFYNGPYPPYAGGGGYLFSGGLIESLYYISQLIPLFPIDDVYTGMCFQALGITPKVHGGFQTFDIQEQDRENLCIHKSLLLVHKRSPKQLKKLWRGVNSPLLTC